MRDPLGLAHRFGPALGAGVAIDNCEDFAHLFLHQTLAAIVNFAAHALGLMFVAERRLDLARQLLGGFPILFVNLILNRAAKRIGIFLAECDRLGAIAEQLLLSDQI